MYTPKHFKVTDEAEIKHFIRDNSFGILFSHDGESPEATHLPFLIEEKGEDTYLIGHFSKGNPQWKSIEDKEVLVVFPGPHSYISASWYEEEGTVPTWNYLTAHVRGICTLMRDESDLKDILKQTAKYYEAPLNQAWNIEEHMDAVNKMLNGIVGFRIKISKIEGKSKLNQNHSEERQAKVIHALENSYDLYDSKEIAKKMKQNLELKR